MCRVNKVHLYTDDGSRGNPSPSAIAVIICTQENHLLREFSECIGRFTNNQAEYRALIRGLDLCAEFTRDTVVCFGDSELVINQMNGVWRLRNAELRNFFHEVRRNAEVFNDVIYQHV
jgi:ribonuclease HI